MKFISPRNPYAKSLRNCVKEGIAAEIVIRAIDIYLIPFALFLGASTKDIGLLISTPQLVSSLSLVMAQRFVTFLGNRRNVLLFVIGVQAALLAVLTILPFFPSRDAFLMLIIIITFFRTIGVLMGPAWGSLVSQYLHQNERGRYFGGRSRLVGIAGLIATACWAGVLNVSQEFSESWGYGILFISLVASRLASFNYIRGMEDIPLKEEHPRRAKKAFLIRDICHRYIPNNNFLTFIAYLAWMTFATQFALPYFSVWLRQGLELNYLWYTAIHMASVITGLIVYPFWGKHSDIVGNLQILRLANILIAVIPLFWILGRHPVALIGIEIFSGFVWAGFNLSSVNFIYDSCGPEQRIRCLVAFNLVTGISAFLGTISGGFLAETLPMIFGHPLLTLFFISSLLRLSGEFFLSSRVLEVRRAVAKVPATTLFFSMIGVRPMTGRDHVHEDTY